MILIATITFAIMIILLDLVVSVDLSKFRIETTMDLLMLKTWDQPDQESSSFQNVEKLAAS